MQGRIFGDFVLGQRIGAGGGGDVDLAEQRTLAREVVVKVITQIDPSDTLDEGGRRFLREVRLASQLDPLRRPHL